MQFYALGYPATLSLPIEVFWLMNKNIDRLQAAQDRRQMLVMNAAQGNQEQFTETLEAMDRCVGTTVVKIDPLDREGLNKLRQLK